MSATAFPTSRGDDSAQSWLSASQNIPESERPAPIHINVSKRLLVVPLCGLGLGFFIGMTRGGSRARLRFLAENAHRPPTTVQGWYFYTKTRNYRVILGAVKQGTKDGLKIAGLSLLYVLGEEGVRKIRNMATGLAMADQAANQELTGQQDPNASPSYIIKRLTEEDRNRAVAAAVADRDLVKDWSEPDNYVWFDGAVTGTVLGSLIGLAFKFPRPLLVQTMTIGGTLGSINGLLRIGHAKFGNWLQQKQMEQKVLEDLKAQEKAVAQDAESSTHTV